MIEVRVTNGKNMRKQDTRKRGSIFYPGSCKRKFFSLNPASPGPTQSNFLLLAGGVFMTQVGYWGVSTFRFGRSNLATIPRGEFPND